ncbi:hypothetical protein PT974_07157 [Cladobotryum mycophilum]|uniref:Zinc-binding loop region of homing endonuclease domain-containing protein n=1 Tax=Cladobotryum mycophilum TaxID=491253 RepID=A0ABR0SPL9_9HYPO
MPSWRKRKAIAPVDLSQVLNQTLSIQSPPSAQPFKRRRLKAPTEPIPKPPIPAAPPVPILPAAQKQLRVFEATSQAWTKAFNELCNGTAPKTNNDSGPSIIKPLTDNDLAFKQELPFGHCWGLWTSKGNIQRPKLREGGTNSDSPRLAGSRLGLAGKDTKIYTYHIIAAHQAATNPSPTLNIDLLRAVSVDKKEKDPWTVMHLCRHKWCHNPEHFAVGLNDEQTACHRMLQSAKTEEEIRGIRSFACRRQLASIPEFCRNFAEQSFHDDSTLLKNNSVTSSRIATTAMASKRSLVPQSGHLRILKGSPKSQVPAVCPFCSLVPARPRSIQSRRHQSTSAPKTPRIELEQTLVELQKRIPTLFNLSRLQLALQGLRQAPGREAVRIAVLGLNNGSDGRDTARKVLKALLVDPLVDEQEWEKELDNHDMTQPLVVRVRANNSSGPRLEVSKGNQPHELHVSSADLNGFQLELLLMDINAPVGGPGAVSVEALERVALAPAVEVPLAEKRITALTTPVHQTLIVADGLMGAVNVSALPILEAGDAILGAVDLKGFSKEKLGANFVVIDTLLAEEGIQLFRQGPQHAMEYEHRWTASNLASLVAWLRAGIKATDDGTKPAVRKLIASVLQGALSAIDAEATSKRLSRDLESKTSSPEVQELNKTLDVWAQKAHAELQGQLDLAFTGSRWRKLGWWKLFWRVDDVAMLTNELLTQRFLPTAEQELVYLTGQIAQLRGEAGPYLQPKPSQNTTKEITNKSETTIITRSALPKWPGHIAFTRRYLQSETVPALQSLAQKLVVQSLATSSLTGILAGLLYVSSFSSTVFEAGAVAALGVVYSLGRMQKKWEAARTFWEGEVREEGRKAVRAAEESTVEVLEGGKPIRLTPQRVEELEKARELVIKAEDALARMK